MITGSFPGPQATNGRICVAWNNQASWIYPDAETPLATLVFNVKSAPDGTVGEFRLEANAESLGDDDMFVSNSPIVFTVGGKTFDPNLRAQIDAQSSVKRDCAVFVDATASGGTPTTFWWDLSGTGAGRFVQGDASFWLFANDLATDENGIAILRVKVGKIVDGTEFEGAPYEFQLKVDEANPQLDLKRFNFTVDGGEVVRFEIFESFATAQTSSYRYSIDWGDESEPSPTFGVGESPAIVAHYYSNDVLAMERVIALNLFDADGSVVEIFELGAAGVARESAALATTNANELRAATLAAVFESKTNDEFDEFFEQTSENLTKIEMSNDVWDDVFDENYDENNDFWTVLEAANGDR